MAIVEIVKQQRAEIVLHAIRWASNMLIEAFANHSPCIPEDARKSLSQAISDLALAIDQIRAADRIHGHQLPPPVPVPVPVQVQVQQPQGLTPEARRELRRQLRRELEATFEEPDR